MEQANNARCPQHVTIECMYYLIKGEARSADVRRIGGVEQKEVVMGFPGWRRTRPAISPEAEVVGSFDDTIDGSDEDTRPDLMKFARCADAHITGQSSSTAMIDCNHSLFMLPVTPVKHEHTSLSNFIELFWLSF